jgi:hypothetical protein
MNKFIMDEDGHLIRNPDFAKYQTIYKTSYGTVKADFKNKMSFEEAEEYGKDYCEKMGFEYIETVKI